MKRAWLGIIFGSSLLLGSCSVSQYLANEEIRVDSSGIDAAVADKFTVSDTKEASLAATNPPPAPEPAASVVDVKSAKKGKSKGKTKGRTAVKAAVPAPKQKKEFELEVRRNGRLPFAPGERTVMALTYFGVEAGTLDLRVLPNKYIGGRKVSHFRGHGFSTTVFALFYRVDDVGDSFMDYDSLFAHKFQLKVDESLQKRDLVEFYDQKAHQVHYWERLIHVKKGLRITQFVNEIQPYTHDAVTAAFYLRTLPLETGKTYSFPVVSNGKSWMVSAKVLRREMLKTEKGEFPAIVVQPETSFEGVLKKTGDIFFWLSDDEHRNFLKVDAKVKVGKVIAYLKDLERGKHEEP